MHAIYWRCWNTSYASSVSSSQQSYEVVTVIPILQKRKLRPEETKGPVLGQTARQCQCWNLNPHLQTHAPVLTLSRALQGNSDLLAQALFVRWWLLPTGDGAASRAQAKGELQINGDENSLCGHLTEDISPGWRGAQRPQTKALVQFYFLQEVLTFTVASLSWATHALQKVSHVD